MSVYIFDRRILPGAGQMHLVSNLLAAEITSHCARGRRLFTICTPDALFYRE